MGIISQQRKVSEGYLFLAEINQAKILGFVVVLGEVIGDRQS